MGRFEKLSAWEDADWCDDRHSGPPPHSPESVGYSVHSSLNLVKCKIGQQQWQEVLLWYWLEQLTMTVLLKYSKLAVIATVSFEIWRNVFLSLTFFVCALLLVRGWSIPIVRENVLLKHWKTRGPSPHWWELWLLSLQYSWGTWLELWLLLFLLRIRARKPAARQ